MRLTRRPRRPARPAGETSRGMSSRGTLVVAVVALLAPAPVEDRTDGHAAGLEDALDRQACIVLAAAAALGDEDHAVGEVGEEEAVAHHQDRWRVEHHEFEPLAGLL